MESAQPIPGAVSTPSSAEREAELIARVLAGDRDRFYELVQPHERAVYLAAYAVLRHEHDAEEVAQEAVLKALRHLKEFRGEARFSTWLVRIAMNEARMRLRKDRRGLYESLDGGRTEGDDEDYVPLQIADWREIPSEAVERQEVREELQRALEQLPEAQREVLVLRDVQQMSIAETAAALDISPALVKVRLFRARLRMRDLLAPRLSATALGGERKKGRNPWL